VTALVDGFLEHRTLDALPVAAADIALSQARAAVEQAAALADGIADELRNVAMRLNLHRKPSGRSSATSSRDCESPCR
jgi:hypothetical protein